MSLPYAVDFRGHPACPCQAKWLPVFEAEAQRRGIIAGPLNISQIIGGASTSGGTHSSGGATDFYPLTGIKQVDGTDGFVWLCRQMGADATWHRRYNWDGAGGVEHVHSVLRGCPHNSPARYQIVAVDKSFNGLGHLGESAADDGPRPLSGRSWQEGIAWAKAQQEEDMADPRTQAQLDRIEQAAKAAEAAAEAAGKKLDNQRERQLKQTTRLREKLDRLIASGQATKAELEAMRADLDDEG